MSQSVVPPTSEERQARRQKTARDAAKQESEQAEQAKPVDALHTELGDTTIADTVVAKIAGIATREVSGVFAMGNAAGRAVGAISQRFSSAKPNVAAGVSVEKGESQTVIDVSVVLDYGTSIVDVSQQIRDNVIRAVEFTTGLEVVAVNVTVSDVHLPGDDNDGSSSPNGNKPSDDLR